MDTIEISGFKVPEQWRKRGGPIPVGRGNDGIFEIYRGRTSFVVVASCGEGWEHVSVHALSEGKNRTPTWAEMCWIKDMFWSKDCVVVQYHPAESDYVNLHKHCLHLWRPTRETMPVPPKILV